MPSNTTAGSTVGDEELTRILTERLHECIVRLDSNSTSIPGKWMGQEFTRYDEYDISIRWNVDVVTFWVDKSIDSGMRWEFLNL